MNISVNELVKNDASVRIHFYNSSNLAEAYKKIKPFKDLGKVRTANYGGSYWVEVSTNDDRISIISFYGGGRKQ